MPSSLFADMLVPRTGGHSGTLVGGALLALFFIIGGVWIARRRRRGAGNKVSAIVLALVCLAPVTVRADVRKGPPRGARVKMVIVRNSAAARGPILQIPEQYVKAKGPGQAQAVVGGLALAGCFAFGGVWLARKRPRVLVPAALGATFLVAGAAFVAGDLWAQPEELQLSEGTLGKGISLSDERSGVVALQIVESDQITLLLPAPEPPRQPRPRR